MTVTLNVPATYVSLTAAIAAIPADISSDQPYIIEVDGNAQLTYAETVTLSGITVSAANFVTIQGKDQADFIMPEITLDVVSSVQYAEYRRIKWTKKFTINSANTLVERCYKATFGSSRRFGIFAADCIIRNNYLELYGYFNSSHSGIAITAVAGVKILGNYMRCDLRAGSGQSPFYALAGTTNLEIVDNIIETTIDLGAGGELINIADAASGLVMNGNVYSQSGTPAHDLVNYNTTGYATLAAFNTATGLEATLNTVGNSTQGLILPRHFVEDKGIDNASLTDDYNGNARTGTMDVGPIGYPAAVDTTPPVFDGGVSGLAVFDDETQFDISAECNAATDAGGGDVFYRWYLKQTDTDPFTAHHILLETDVPEILILLPNAMLWSIGVHAVDESRNETTNTDYLTVTPTSSSTSPLAAPTLNSVTTVANGTSVTINITPPANPDAIYDFCQVQYKLRGDTDWITGVTFAGTPEVAGDVVQGSLTNQRIYDFQVIAVDTDAKFSAPVKIDSIYVKDTAAQSEDELMLDNLETLLANSATFQDWIGATGDAAAKLAAAKARIYKVGEDADTALKPFIVINGSPSSYNILAIGSYGVDGILSAEFWNDVSDPDLSYEAIRQEFSNKVGAIIQEISTLAGTNNFLCMDRASPLTDYERYEEDHADDLQTIQYEISVPAF